MKLSITKKIDLKIYKVIESFENYSVFHTKMYHQFLKDALGWDIKAILIYDDQDKLIFCLPFISKYRVSPKCLNISLPLTHTINAVYDSKYLSKKENFWTIIQLYMDNLEVHQVVDNINFQKRHLYDITMLYLDQYESLEDLEKSYDYKSIRYMINRAHKNGIVIKKDISKKAISDFYQLMLETRMRQGSPIYPTNFFKVLFESFPIELNQVNLYLGYYNDIPISGAIFLHDTEYTYYQYSASVNDKELKKMGGNELLLAEAIKDSFLLGKRKFDFGITPISLPGLRKYKEKWGGETKSLHYSIYKKTGNFQEIKRDSKMVDNVSNFLKKLHPKLFKLIGPILLKRVI